MAKALKPKITKNCQIKMNNFANCKLKIDR